MKDPFITDPEAGLNAQELAELRLYEEAKKARDQRFLQALEAVDRAAEQSDNSTTCNAVITIQVSADVESCLVCRYDLQHLGCFCPAGPVNSDVLERGRKLSRRFWIDRSSPLKHGRHSSVPSSATRRSIRQEPNNHPATRSSSTPFRRTPPAEVSHSAESTAELDECSSAKMLAFGGGRKQRRRRAVVLVPVELNGHLTPSISVKDVKARLHWLMELRVYNMTTELNRNNIND
ncbi:hypothetical protein BDV96DRAFT_650502 [Lophiotrema nucula]|uniref:Uncharacterized protein n=1 Tax=Lophiotrema nucula TaxID=690887 RepID=A0A6A5YUV1_9PLEO|nr:hypothetical protein BDV96DRAFT_650502 [Lophiotrema nucula]